MPYEIEFEDQQQDLLRLTVDADSGAITCANAYGDMYTKGNYFVDTAELTESRMVRFRRADQEDFREFRWPMRSVALNGKMLCSVDGVAR